MDPFTIEYVMMAHAEATRRMAAEMRHKTACANLEKERSRRLKNQSAAAVAKHLARMKSEMAALGGAPQSIAAMFGVDLEDKRRPQVKHAGCRVTSVKEWATVHSSHVSQAEDLSLQPLANLSMDCVKPPDRSRLGIIRKRPHRTDHTTSSMTSSTTLLTATASDVLSPSVQPSPSQSPSVSHLHGMFSPAPPTSARKPRNKDPASPSPPSASTITGGMHLPQLTACPPRKSSVSSKSPTTTRPRRTSTQPFNVVVASSPPSPSPTATGVHLRLPTVLERLSARVVGVAEGDFLFLAYGRAHIPSVVFTEFAEDSTLELCGRRVPVMRFIERLRDLGNQLRLSSSNSVDSHTLHSGTASQQHNDVQSLPPMSFPQFLSVVFQYPIEECISAARRHSLKLGWCAELSEPTVRFVEHLWTKWTDNGNELVTEDRFVALHLAAAASSGSATPRHVDSEQADAELRTLFQLADKNNDGILDKGEFAKYFSISDNRA